MPSPNLGPRSRDWVSSLVVFVVAVPLSLGVAIASGGSPSSGLISAIIGGIVGGALAGAPLAVTGPAAGLTALVFQLIQQHGIQAMSIITVLGGVFQLLFWLVRSGKLFMMIPRAVLEGTLSAIGFIIVVGQLHVLMGAGVPKSPLVGLATLHESFLGNFGGTNGVVSAVLVCGVLAIIIQKIWGRLGKLALIPAALPAVVLVSLVALPFEMPRVEISPLLPAVMGQAEWFFGFSWLSSLPGLILAGLGVAVVASAESLLCARAVDTLCVDIPEHKNANLDRELMAQGCANLVSGVLGGLPMTAVVVRSAANVNSGAQTRWSTMLHGVWIALFVGLLPMVVAAIPLTALASVLVLTGLKLLNLPHLRRVFEHDRIEGSLWIATSCAIFATNLLSGLLIGLWLAVMVHLYKAKYKAKLKPLTNN